MTIKRGDRFRHEQPEREPWQVLRYVRNEFISLTSAREEYGVGIDLTS